MSATPHKELLVLSLQELTAIVRSFGQPAYRGRQLFDAIYRQRVERLENITTLPQELRKNLAEDGYEVGQSRVEKSFQSVDGTIRYLIAFSDGQSVETVWMPEGDEGEAGDGSEAAADLEAPAAQSQRATICVSSQIGCAVDCRFCLTALLGVKRNLAPGEIVGQVLAVLRDRQVEPERRRINLVFMGQGEPFLNYDAFMQAVRLLAEGVGISTQRMTVSTSGIVPRIQDLGREPVRPKLAISLNGSNDEVRTRIMPINRKWDLAKLMAAAREFPLRDRERLTFEYVLLEGVNDTAEHARELADLVRGIRAKVNLIALNPGAELPYRTPAQERVLEFQRILVGAGIATFIRRPRGRDIFAACGQLKRTVKLPSAS